MKLEATSVVDGIDDEMGFIVFDVSFAKSMILLEKYKQNAIFWADKIKTTLLLNELK
jgi:hypothetical protein